MATPSLSKGLKTVREVFLPSRLPGLIDDNWRIVHFLLPTYTLVQLVVYFAVVLPHGILHQTVGGAIWAVLDVVLLIVGFAMKKPKRFSGVVAFLSVFAALILSYTMFLDLAFITKQNAVAFHLALVIMGLFYTLPITWVMIATLVPATLYGVLVFFYKDLAVALTDCIVSFIGAFIAIIAAGISLFWKGSAISQAEALRAVADTDPLTGLPNRRKLDEHFNAIDQNSAVVPLGMIFLDLNGLKRVNDTEGHKAGDALLTDFARHISGLANGHFFCRVSGDEFLLLTENQGAEDFHKLCVDIRRYLDESSPPKAAMGTIYLEDGGTYDEMLTASEESMRIDKERIYSSYPEIKR